MSHEWILTLHIVSVVCWLAALFYLPRLFVYHAQAEDSISIERFKIMERKLYRGIGTPAMLASLIFGLWLVSLSPEYYLSQRWFLIKAGLVVLLIGYHGACWYFLVQFRKDQVHRNHIFFRWFNEMPVILLIGIVAMVIVRPFQ